MRLKGKVAVITGGATGIGFAAARRFLAEGAKVVIAGRRQASLDRAVAELGGNVLAVDADVTSLPDLRRLMTVVQERHGRIDVLVANAGIGRFGPMESVTPEVFDELTNVHFRGAFFTVQQAVPMTRAYNAAKAAVRSLARTFVSPGLTVTPMTQGDIGVPAEKRDEAAKAQLSLIPQSSRASCSFWPRTSRRPSRGPSWFLTVASRKCDSESRMDLVDGVRRSAS